jgi:hypothetical protein
MGPVVVCFLPVNEFATTRTSGKGEGTALAEARSHAARVAHARARRRKAGYARHVSPEQRSSKDVSGSYRLYGDNSQAFRHYSLAGPEVLIASKGLDPFLAVADDLSAADSKQLAECS